MRQKGARWVPNHNWAHRFLGPKSDQKPHGHHFGHKSVGPNFGHGPPWTNSSAMASGNHQRPPDQLSPPFPSTPGDFFLSSIPSVLKVAGMVHIWYYIPLCTIYAQQSNGDALRTQFHLSKIKVSNPNTHFEGGLISSFV
ncbi:hypothetical protein O181_094753 [Austropuccinia psidii MF-1]|uniref:Uncharacterized protein n=1 Tax=Austropuccinia psidii MF-1 TaxID=1389203 RepID=A0A9Q3J2L8_9BASI|nr:hypothetical protein [Austropuccinia psidii MF-1]